MSVTVSNESHSSSTGSSSSALFGGGGSEPLTQAPPAKPTWAQILNSTPNAPSNSSSSTTAANNPNTAAAGNHTPSSSSPSSQHSATTKNISPSASGTLNMTGARSGFMPNFYEQQPQQSQMNWSLNFNQSSSWMMNDDDSQRPPTNSSQDNTQIGGGDGFDRLESSSPTSDWNKPVTNNSTANGWSNFRQPNPSRSNPKNNQWPEMSIYGASTPTNSFNLPQQNTDNNSSSTWQDPSASSATDALTLTANNSKHKTSSMAASITGALKTAIAMSGTADLLGGDGDSMITYVPQPKLVEQLGWDAPELSVMKRATFDDGTSVWGDPMDSSSVPVKKWTNGTKAALTNSTNLDQQPPQQQQQQTVQKPVPTAAAPSSRMSLNDENWPKQQSPTMAQQPPQAPPSVSSQWNDTSSVNIDQPNPSHQQQQQQNYRPQPSNWNPQSQSSDDWFREGVVDTSDWGLQGAQHKAPFDPYDGQVDTSGWGLPSGGGMPGQMPMPRNRFPTEYDPNDNPHDARLSGYDNDPYRQNPDLKSPMMNLAGNLPASHHPFPPRPSSLYPNQPGSILRPINPNGGLSTPPGAIIGQGSHSSSKLPTASPIPNVAPYKGNNPSSQTPTPSQQSAAGNGNNTNNNGAVHAQIMQQFRLAVQAGLISQDLLNTKLPPYMLQLLQRLFELQQKFQQLSMQLSELSKNKPHFPLPLLQSEYERLTKAIQQKKQEMLLVQKEIQDAHAKLKQQAGNPTPTPSQMMSNGPGSGQNSDESRFSHWTKQSTIGGQRSSMFPPPPGLTQKDWQTDNNDPNENWESSQTNESNSNQMGNSDPHAHNHQASGFGDPFSNLVDDIDGPPPFVPGQLWSWKPSLPNAEDDPHVTPSSFPIGPKGSGSPMGNLNVGGAESAFSNPQLMHSYQRQLPPNRSQWQQGSLHDQQGFQPPMNDWMKQQQQQQQQQQYRGTSKAPPPPHPSFGGGGGGGGGYRPYM